MTKVFFVGATGHIGSAVVTAILAKFPDVEITALVRDHGKAQRLEKVFPRLRAVIGDYQNLDLIKNESKAAGIVVNTAPDQLPGSPSAITATLHGLSSRPTEKAFYIHTSGAFLISEESHGARASDKIWNDFTDIAHLTTTTTSSTTLPPDRDRSGPSPHQLTDQLVRDAASPTVNVNVAIISPTVVYGASAAAENPVPITLRDIVTAARALGAGFTVGQGRNILGYVHVDDLADVYVRLVADAVKIRGAAGSDDDARLWGRQAYYFANAEELTFAEYMAALVGVLRRKGVVATDVIEQIGSGSDSDSDSDSDAAAAEEEERELVNRTVVAHGCGANVRCRSERAERLLGWKPKERGVKATLPEVVGMFLERDGR